MPKATNQALQEAERGRLATRPQEIPAKGWRDILLRVKEELAEDNFSIVAAGVAFYGLLALFPALAALVSIYGLVADPADVQQQLNALAGVLPEQARTLLNEELSTIAAQPKGALSIGVIAGLLLTLWSASKGTKTLMEALNVAYDEEEKRGFLSLNTMALLLTLGAILLAVLAIGLVVVLPALLEFLGLQESAETWIFILQWLVLAIVVAVGMAILYHYGPSRDQPRWQWVSWGAVVATVLWIIASLGFSFYVANFSDYNETYGSLGAVVILLMWFFISAYIVLLGAELNAEMEHQTRMDTTEGKPEPMGQRKAYVADTVGRVPGEEDADHHADNDRSESVRRR